MAHKDICIKFQIEDRCYEAVGFLNKNESQVSFKAALSRTAEKNGGAIGNDDETFLFERLSKLPKELREYFLVTGRLNDEYPYIFSYFYYLVSGWFRLWLPIEDRLRRNELIIRRCP